jgi:hypothetical protein
MLRYSPWKAECAEKQANEVPRLYGVYISRAETMDGENVYTMLYMQKDLNQVKSLRPVL